MCVGASHAPITNVFALTNPTTNLVCTDFVGKEINHVFSDSDSPTSAEYCLQRRGSHTLDDRPDPIVMGSRTNALVDAGLTA